MSIVVDTNVFGVVFDSSSVDHSEFAPVRDWIEKRDGFLLFGGTTYKNELFQSHRRTRLVRLLKDAGSAIEISTAAVDRIESQVRSLVSGTSCNDPHIIALLAAASCSLLCSRDKESFPFIKDKRYYPKGAPRVRIYTGSRNRKLLSPGHRSTITNTVN